ncbi:MAG: autotransporter adhesin [Chitinophagaceae bacterium]|nr:autotransporter adhesin [Chitinophagaceae bacterium]
MTTYRLMLFFSGLTMILLLNTFPLTQQFSSNEKDELWHGIAESNKLVSKIIPHVQLKGNLIKMPNLYIDNNGITLSSISQLQEYSGLANRLIINDVNRGGIFLYTESATPDYGLSFPAAGKGSGCWVRQFTGAINIKWYGAKGDGITIDNVAIQKAFTNGGKIFVPKSSSFYAIDFSELTASYQNVFNLKSNTTIEFQPGAEFRQVGILPRITYLGMFGVQAVDLPVTGLIFKRLYLNATTGNTIMGIKLSVDQSVVAVTHPSVQNVVIENCKFNHMGSSIYILQRSNMGSLYRQVKNVTIINNTAMETPGSFVTADGEDILIQGNKAIGSSISSRAYDAVSIHSGVNVRIIGNHWSNFGKGQALNIRNSPENHCGSRNIYSSGNFYIRCRTAVQISIWSGEPTYGVEGVTIKGETISNPSVGIGIIAGGAVRNTSFQDINVFNNVIKNCSNAGMDIQGSVGGVAIQNIKIVGNKISTNSKSTLGVHLKQLINLTFSNNQIHAKANIAGYKLLKIEGEYILNSKLSNNILIADNVRDSSNAIFSIGSLNHSIFRNNTLKGYYKISAPVETQIINNNFQSSGELNGHLIHSGLKEVLTY